MKLSWYDNEARVNDRKNFVSRGSNQINLLFSLAMYWAAEPDPTATVPLLGGTGWAGWVGIKSCSSKSAKQSPYISTDLTYLITLFPSSFRPRAPKSMLSSPQAVVVLHGLCRTLSMPIASNKKVYSPWLSPPICQKLCTWTFSPLHASGHLYICDLGRMFQKENNNEKLDR